MSGDNHNQAGAPRDVDEIVDELMERAEEIGRELRGDNPRADPPGIDPVRLREILRANLRESIVKARGEVSS